MIVFNLLCEQNGGFKCLENQNVSNSLSFFAPITFGSFSMINILFVFQFGVDIENLLKNLSQKVKGNSVKIYITSSPESKHNKTEPIVQVNKHSDK